MAFFQREQPRVHRKIIQSVLPQCGRCGRKKTYQNGESSCIPVSGEGGKGILIIREQPTADIAFSGNWLAKSKGRSLIATALEDVDIDPQVDCWMTGACICHGKGQSMLSIECCRPNLGATIKELQPKVIIPLGISATQAVLSFLWKEGSGDMTRFFGYQVPVRRWNTWVCPTYDSAYIMSLGSKFADKYGKSPDTPSGMGGVAYLWMTRHIAEAVAKADIAPFSDDSDPQSHIQFLYNADKIEEVLEQIGNYEKGYAAFDYETNCIKPEVNGARVLCASVCLGGWNKDWKTIAFPMSNQVKPAWCRFLQSPIPKIAHNVKFETNWSRVLYKTEINNWAGDTMLNAHILDCRRGVTGLKYQVMANFGEGGYEDATQAYMSGGEGKFNRLTEVPIETLLTYNALDSYYTWRLFVQQMRKFEVTPYWQ